MFKGSYTALVTPLKEGKIDEGAFAKFVEWQIDQGINGLVPSGTTGESPTLSHEEHNLLISLCVDTAAGRVPVLAGTGSNATHEAISTTQHAQQAGADGALIVCPYYNKPTEAGLYEHYKAIHDNTDIPIILYNVPARTVTNMTNELISKLAELPRIVGLKDATGDLSRPTDLKTRVFEDFIQLSGEDDTAVEFNEIGGSGVISVTSNILPAQVTQIQKLSLEGEIEKAKELQQEIMSVHNAMFFETSPGPVKYAASLLGFCSEEMRLPLVPPGDENKKLIRSVMEKLGLL